MPDILIRGMEMPDSCSDCPMCYDMIECTVSPLRFWHGRPENEQFDFCNERHPVCPLHELPPHGDLIDRNELLSTKTDPIHKTMIFGGQYVISEDAIKNAPVVIPAERRESHD